MEQQCVTKKIKDMHYKFGITHKHVPFSPEEKAFRITAMQEELDEYVVADNLEDELDAMIDLIVFALGTIERQGLLDVFVPAYNRVMEANLAKEVGTNAKRGNFQLDLVKPEGWTPPVLTDLVQEVNQQELFGEDNGR